MKYLLMVLFLATGCATAKIQHGDSSAKSFEEYKSCVLGAARTFAATKDAVDVTIRAAHQKCSSEKARYTKAVVADAGPKLKYHQDRKLKEILEMAQQEINNAAELAIIESRSSASK